MLKAIACNYPRTRSYGRGLGEQGDVVGRLMLGLQTRIRKISGLVNLGKGSSLIVVEVAYYLSEGQLMNCK